MEDVLVARNYEKVATTCVQTLTLGGPVTETQDAEILDVADDGRMADYGRIKRIDRAELGKTKAVLDRIGMVKKFVSIRVDGYRAAAGIAAIEDAHVGLFGIATDPDHRRKGLGGRVTDALLGTGYLNGARQAHLQVEADNRAALELYGGKGFHDLYRYWYRVKECGNG